MASLENSNVCGEIYSDIQSFAMLRFLRMDYQEYFVVTALNLEDLMETVKERLKAGWNCQGGVFIYSLDSSNPDKNRLYHQAMVK